MLFLKRILKRIFKSSDDSPTLVPIPEHIQLIDNLVAEMRKRTDPNRICKIRIQNFAAYELPEYTEISITFTQLRALFRALENPFQEAMNSDDIWRRYSIEWVGHTSNSERLQEQYEEWLNKCR